MPKWIAEQEILENESQRERIGAPLRDLSGYSEWRDEATPEVVLVINFYAEYLTGQTDGFSESLPLPAILAAFEIDGVPVEDRPEMTQMVIQFHNEVMRIMKRKQKMADRRRG